MSDDICMVLICLRDSVVMFEYEEGLFMGFAYVVMDLGFSVCQADSALI